MDVDHPHREFSGVGRDGAGRGPAGHQNLLLHHCPSTATLDGGATFVYPWPSTLGVFQWPPSCFFCIGISGCSCLPALARIPFLSSRSPTSWPAQPRASASQRSPPSYPCAACRAGSILGSSWSRQRLRVPSTSRVVRLSTTSALRWTPFTR